MKTWFISDTHLNHKRILLYTKRPYSSIEEMNEGIISNWNSVVKDEDQIYHLGDVGMGSPASLATILRQLKGHKFLIRGNHDKSIRNEAAECFEWIKDLARIYINNQLIVMCHYPMLVWEKSHYDSFMLHGHCHNSLNELNKTTKRLDVGVDNFNCAPVSFEQVKEIMDKKIYTPMDRHGTENK